MASISKYEQETIMNLLEENKLTFESILYRYTSEKHLKKKDDGTEVLIANNAPADMVVDNYKGQGHVYVAREIGPGLSFMTEQLEEYVRDDRVCVSVKIRDLIAGGGLIYKVSSLPEYVNAFFFTLPGGEVPVITV